MNIDIMLIELEGNEAEDIVEALHKREYKISMHLAKCVMKALETGTTNFQFAEIIFTDGKTIGLGCKEVDYKDALEKQREILERYEEYELCKDLQDWIEKLK